MPGAALGSPPATQPFEFRQPIQPNPSGGGTPGPGGFTIPNDPSAAVYPAAQATQAMVDFGDVQAIVAGLQSTGVLAGCFVRPLAGAGMVVTWSAGTAAVQGAQVTIAAGMATLANADPTNDRIDLVVVDGTGGVAVITGTPGAAGPGQDYPAVPLDSSGRPVRALLASVRVGASATSVAVTDITDKRVLLPFALASGQTSPSAAGTPVSVGGMFFDWTNGGLYVGVSNYPTNTLQRWFQIGGCAPYGQWNQGVSTHNRDGANSSLTLADTFVLCYGPSAGAVTISDTTAINTYATGGSGTGNNLGFYGTGVDGQQYITFQLGSTGQFTWTFAANGSSSLPGTLTVTGATTFNGLATAAAGLSVTAFNSTSMFALSGSLSPTGSIISDINLAETISLTASVTDWNGINISPTISSSVSQKSLAVAGLRVGLVAQGSNSYPSVSGIVVAPSIGETATTGYGIYNIPTVSAGTTTTMYGMNFGLTVSSGATVTTGYGLAIGASNSGTLTTFVGLDIGVAQSLAGSTIWAVKVGNYNSYFNGKTAFGGTSTPTWDIHLQGGNSAASGIGIDVSTTGPTAPGSSASAVISVYKGTTNYYLLVTFNDAGTTRYRYMELNGTTATWTEATSLPT